VLFFTLLTTLTHWPTMDPLGPEHTPPDKLLHFIAFGLLAILVERAALLPRAWMAFLLVALWAPVDEWTQQTFSTARTLSVLDIAGNWIGVLAAIVASSALAPARRSVRAIDDMAIPGNGGLTAGFVGAAVAFGMFPLLFAGLWLGFSISAGTLCTLLALATGLLVSWPLVRRSWNRVGGPKWPVPSPVSWLAVPLGVAGGWGIAVACAAAGYTSLGTPWMLFGAIGGGSLVLRSAMARGGTAADV
jgi:VanZ family protein